MTRNRRLLSQTFPAVLPALSMSSSWTDPEGTAWPEDAPGPTDAPTGEEDESKGERTGEKKAAQNQEKEPPV